MAQLDAAREFDYGLHGVWLAARWGGVLGTQGLSIYPRR